MAVETYNQNDLVNIGAGFEISIKYPVDLIVDLVVSPEKWCGILRNHMGIQEGVWMLQELKENSVSKPRRILRKGLKRL